MESTRPASSSARISGSFGASCWTVSKAKNFTLEEGKLIGSGSGRGQWLDGLEGEELHL